MRLRKVLAVLLLILLVFLVGLYVYSQTRLRARSLDSLRSLGMTKSLDSRLRGNDMVIGNNTETFEYAKVKQVVDGDTIKLESGETVRYIGVNTPEVYEYDKQTNKWSKNYKCYGQEAMRKNQELVEGKVVRLEKDVSEKDKYERLLRYVFACEEPSPMSIGGQGEFCNQFVNLELVAGGFAKVMTVLPDKKYELQILAAEKEARERKRGLWEACQN